MCDHEKNKIVPWFFDCCLCVSYESNKTNVSLFKIGNYFKTQGNRNMHTR